MVINHRTWYEYEINESIFLSIYLSIYGPPIYLIKLIQQGGSR